MLRPTGLSVTALLSLSLLTACRPAAAPPSASEVEARENAIAVAEEKPAPAKKDEPATGKQKQLKQLAAKVKGELGAAIDSGKGAAPLFLLRGLIGLREKQFDSAIKDLEKAVELDEKDGHARVLLALARSKKAGLPDLLRAELVKARAKDRAYDLFAAQGGAAFADLDTDLLLWLHVWQQGGEAPAKLLAGAKRKTIDAIVAHLWCPSVGNVSESRANLEALLVALGADANDAVRRSHRQAATLSRKVQEDAVTLAGVYGRAQANRIIGPIRAYAAAVEGSHKRVIDRIGLSNEKFKPTPAARLKRDDEELAALLAAKKVKPASKEEARALAALLAHEERAVVFAAVRALGKAGPTAKEAIPDLAGLMAFEYYLGSHDQEIAKAAAKAMQDLGPADKASLPRLRALLKHENGGVRGAAAFQLGRMGPEAEAAVSDLRPLLSDDLYFAESAARGALVKIGSPAAVRAFIGELWSAEHRRRHSAALRLGEMGPKAKAAIPDLVRLLNDNGDRGPYVIPYAVFALGKIGPDAVPALLKKLGDKDGRSLLNAVRALREMGPGAKESVPALETLAATHRVKAVRDEAKEALRAIRKK